MHAMSAYPLPVARARRPGWGALLVLCGLALTVQAQAQDGTGALKPVYRCPGPPVLYTDGLTSQEALEQGCRSIKGAPVTIMQMPSRPRPAANGATVAAAPTAAPANRPGETRVDPAAQRARDTDARRILNEELKREEERLQVLLKDFNGGEPERRGDERNFAKYQERVAELKAAVARKEADVAALRREISKLPQ